MAITATAAKAETVARPPVMEVRVVGIDLPFGDVMTLTVLASFASLIVGAVAGVAGTVLWFVGSAFVGR